MNNLKLLAAMCDEINGLKRKGKLKDNDYLSHLSASAEEKLEREGWVHRSDAEGWKRGS
jgi:hypothetical protein